MSAGGLARLGVRCADASTGMATIGVFCGELVELDQRLPGGGSKRSRQQVPGITSNRAIAMREDEEIIAVLQAFLASRRKH
jgi:hypothetical protein